MQESVRWKFILDWWRLFVRDACFSIENYCFEYDVKCKIQKQNYGLFFARANVEIEGNQQNIDDIKNYVYRCNN